MTSHAPSSGIDRRPSRYLVSATLVLSITASSRVLAGVETLTYSVGEPGTPFHSVFSWTVSGVLDRGTFVDGSPWITVEPGAELVAVSPTSRRMPCGGGLSVVVDGTCVNPRMMHRFDPQSLQLVGNGLQKFDSRRIFLVPPTTQAALDATFDHDANVGMVDPSTGSIEPVPLEPGDVVVTAHSEWRTEGLGGWTSSGALPHVSPFRRTPIDRFGVLTVLHEPISPKEPHFRPPLQWPEGAEAQRPDPISLADIIPDESALLHSRRQPTADLEWLLESPTFHDAHGILYQSAHAQHALSADPERQGSVVYGGTLGKVVLKPLLLAATDGTQPDGIRELCRDRLIQYGIDAYGAAMCLGFTRAGAGQRAAELKPWIILAGWWLDRPEMRNPYASIRAMYAGTAVASLDDIAIGRMIFHDDHVPRQVVAGLNLGGPYHRTWGPGLTHRVVGAGHDSTARLVDSVTIDGRFGRLDISGATPHPSIHARDPKNYYGCSLRVESGPGSGPTVYQVVEVGETNGAIGQFVKVDRPWQDGLPGPGSTVRMFPFRNGDHAPGIVSDIGRWYYSTNGQAGNLSVDCLSPAANAYCRISYQALLVPHAALKRLADVTGDPDYLRGSTWHWLAEAVGGTGQSLSSRERFGETPDAERTANQVWSSFPQSGLRSHQRRVVQDWVAGDGGGSFGTIDRSRIPATTFIPDVLTAAPCVWDDELELGVRGIRSEPGRVEEIGWIGTIHATTRLRFEAPVDGVFSIELRPLNRSVPAIAVSSLCDFASPLDVSVVPRRDLMAPISVLFDAQRGTSYLVLVGSLQPETTVKAEIEVTVWTGLPDGEDDDGSAGDDGETGDP